MLEGQTLESGSVCQRSRLDYRAAFSWRKIQVDVTWRLSSMWSKVSTLAYGLLFPCTTASDHRQTASSTSSMSSALEFDIAAPVASSAKKATVPAKPVEEEKKKPSKDVDEESEDEDDEDDGQTVVSAASANGNGKKKSKKRKNPFGDTTAKHLCAQAGVTKKTPTAGKMINQMVLDLVMTIAERAVALTALQNRSTILEKDIQNAVREAFRTEVYMPPASTHKSQLFVNFFFDSFHPCGE